MQGCSDRVVLRTAGIFFRVEGLQRGGKDAISRVAHGPRQSIYSLGEVAKFWSAKEQCRGECHGPVVWALNPAASNRSNKWVVRTSINRSEAIRHSKDISYGTVASLDGFQEFRRLCSVWVSVQACNILIW